MLKKFGKYLINEDVISYVDFEEKIVYLKEGNGIGFLPIEGEMEAYEDIYKEEKNILDKMVKMMEEPIKVPNFGPVCKGPENFTLGYKTEELAQALMNKKEKIF